MTQSFPRKYWWAVLVVVPIAVALISIVPSLLSGDSSPTSTTFDLQGAQFDGEVTMIDTQLIMEQIHEGADGEQIEALLQRAINLSKTGFQEEAIALFEDLAERTQSPEIFNNLGALYTANGRTEEANTAFREGLARRPDSESLALNLARLYAQENRVGEALNILDTAAPRTDSADALRNVLTARLSTGRHELEPNNSANQPTTMQPGAEVFGHLSDDEDIDFYAFTVGPAPRDWTRIHVQTLTPLKLFLQVFNPDKSLHWQSIPHDNRVTAGQDVTAELVLAPEQRYFVAVSSIRAAGNYELHIEPLKLFDRFEPNDISQTATNISINQTIEASILDERDVDYYQIAGGSSINILLRNFSQVLQPRVVVFDGDHRRLWQNAGWANQVGPKENVRGTITDKSAKSFYIAVSSLGGKGDYTLTLSE